MIFHENLLLAEDSYEISYLIGFQDQLYLNAGQKYCRMLQGEHSAILSTFIKLPFVIFVLSIFEWLLKTGFTVKLENYVKKFCGWCFQAKL